MDQTRKIIHVDMDCFYAQVEMRDDPSLAGLPIAVGGNAARGVLSTCNYLAREFGVRSAMPVGLAKKKCPTLVVLPGRMQVYKDISKQIRAIFQRYTEIIEPLSLDEAFLDVSDCQLFNGSATLIAEAIRKDIVNETGLTASAGVSNCKFVAKVASDVNKPNGICVVPPEQVKSFVEAMPVKRIPGVGKVMQERLAEHNIEYCRDLLEYSEKFLVNRFGKMGKALYLRARGVDNRELVTHREAKSTTVETTFAEDKAVNEIDNELLEKLLGRLEGRLKSNDKPVSKVSVKVKFADFELRSKESQSKGYKLETYMDMIRQVAALQPHKKIRLVGIGVGFGKLNEQQMPLF